MRLKGDIGFLTKISAWLAVVKVLFKGPCLSEFITTVLTVAWLISRMFWYGTPSAA